MPSSRVRRPTPYETLRMILAEGLVLAAIGLATGLAGALVLTRYLASLLFEVGGASTPRRSSGASLLAGFVPARRAMRVDPVTALRQE